MSHEWHGSYTYDVHVDGLSDLCAKCRGHGAEPFRFLDDRMLAMLRDRVEADLPARSEAERVAMRAVRDVQQAQARMERLG